MRQFMRNSTLFTSQNVYIYINKKIKNNMTKSVMIIKNTYTFYTNFKGGIMKHMSYKNEPYIKHIT